MATMVSDEESLGPSPNFKTNWKRSSLARKFSAAVVSGTDHNALKASTWRKNTLPSRLRKRSTGLDTPQQDQPGSSPASAHSRADTSAHGRSRFYFPEDSPAGLAAESEGIDELSAPSSSGDTNERSTEAQQRKLHNKITVTRDRLRTMTLAHEADVEEFLAMNGSHASADNPQMLRIRQMFERKNKKHAQEADQLQRKLEALLLRETELDGGSNNGHGTNGSSSARGPNVLSNMGTGLKGMRDNIKDTLTDYTGSVISMPKGLATRIKSKWGSADNIHAAVAGADPKSPDVRTRQRSGSKKAPLSTSPYYAANNHSASARDMQLQTQRDRSPQPGLLSAAPAQHSNEQDNLGTGTGTSSQLTALGEEINRLRQARLDADQELSALKQQLAQETDDFHNALHSERFRFQRIEDQLNDMIELQQAETASLKQEMSNMANRLEYQHMDSLRDLKELLENAHNRLAALEQRVDSPSDHSPSPYQSVSLHFANIFVELIKLVMFMITLMCDLVKPITGSRNRAAGVIGLVLLVLIVVNCVPWSAVFGLFSKRTVLNTNTPPSTDALPSTPDTTTL